MFCTCSVSWLLWFGYQYIIYYQYIYSGTVLDGNSCSDGIKSRIISVQEFMACRTVMSMQCVCFRTIAMASRLLNTLGKIGIGLAITGSVLNTALYNGEFEFL